MELERIIEGEQTESPPETEQPKRYRALVNLSYPTDPQIIRRIRAGENVPWHERKMKHVPIGHIAEDIPKVSIPWLLKSNKIEEVQ